ncbi:GMP/IMP nucleotidase YrfG [Zhongshania aliphaticivorans]|uniref:GMP/IMP nucleotidase YrfG n=1 Tax=Zhongshania aliphaticivorans TaxID=1470434 RepID=A0A5S9Q874_9GAMM|nr:GMP/IMP nucleotidase [Zhongshania aliphaticivorans]CAA0103434.1 GMP/IMP nucleotidase YrfG [Zhongshania aliphaticivorans]CAA0113502.1 GMP/IMP nucleotidase YrfG [Zhongshania aliphaticivorans]
MIDWQAIDTVLLDMDGTLLDLHYDNFFWTQHLPRRYADIHGGDPSHISEDLLNRIMAEKGSLNWYCLDYWSEQLKVDIVALKREVAHLIAPHPSTKAFLSALNDSHCNIWLVTNAHRGSLDLKLEYTDLGQHITKMVSSHEFGKPKEDPAFWQQLQQRWHFNPERTLLVDDTTSVLDSAAAFGIRHLLTLRQPDSKQALRDTLPYPAVLSFAEILPITPPSN